MSALAFVVILAEVAAFFIMLTYATVLTSMHIEAVNTTEPPPKLDAIGRSLVSAAKWGFQFGILAVIVGSLFWKGLK